MDRTGLDLCLMLDFGISIVAPLEIGSQLSFVIPQGKVYKCGISSVYQNCIDALHPRRCKHPQLRTPSKIIFYSWKSRIYVIKSTWTCCII
jgi:hypothetical protein